MGKFVQYMSACVFIIGTNCVGKTTLAKEIMRRFGGIKDAKGDTTYCRDKRVTFAGVYKEGSKYGGVDGLGQTKCLAEIVDRALQVSNVCFCDGSYLNTFGVNLTNAIFTAKQQLVVFLYAPVEVIRARLQCRSGGGITKSIVSKQLQAARAAKKWSEIGVPVLCFDTSKITAEDIATKIIEKLKLQ